MTRARLLLAARAAFVVLTIAFAWWGFRGRWDDISDAIGAVGPGRIGVAVAITLVGLALTAALWRHLLAGSGSRVPPRDAGAIFFVGQLGKYVPGSVWSFLAQAELGRRHRVPARSSVAASAVFLLLHTFTGIVLGSSLAATGVLATGGPWWLWTLAAACAAAALAPPVVRALGSRIAGPSVVEVSRDGRGRPPRQPGDGRHETSFAYASRDLFVAVALMLAVWVSYGAAMLVLLPSSASPAAALGAFALAHAAGVLLVFAPAGLGAREGVLIALLSPVVGTAPAAAAALLARVVHTMADFLAAALAAAAVRGRTHAPESSAEHQLQRTS